MGGIASCSLLGICFHLGLLPTLIKSVFFSLVQWWCHCTWTSILLHGVSFMEKSNEIQWCRQTWNFVPLFLQGLVSTFYFPNLFNFVLQRLSIVTTSRWMSPLSSRPKITSKMIMKWCWIQSESWSSSLAFWEIVLISQLFSTVKMLKWAWQWQT